MAAQPPPISHILETCLYVRDVGASVDFYKSVLNSAPFMQSPRMAGFSLGSTTLLLFQLGVTSKGFVAPKGGTIPGHGPSESIISSLLSDNPGDRTHLKQHFCFAVGSPADVTQWDAHLQKLGVPVTGRIDWDLGGKSIYFADPDGHVGEVGSRGIWKHY
ncbi:Glyoxalase/Bleomycin resistance protein/Dihydroxybiphenyl dioxygenase [Talaromyces proteolyticus]|uniref:Glyoxalase/Bleomycin resistance protein/Dihydroxybiphenyl dioxygenase n=1 Tax=Talaromyces proteolyticus TaxID=1131652 RepID=A0AAD4KSB3_9EURO|nr:Glyoxalase/Bleomycin resistance protein/Dihydroxybiphenyl dioxygenase [Talaromyces proteolyticus]KAH8698312.1 Glyoxalase/Bleomycin resistance protein/Dihydroxybiphenyl dioxygenase [Talaromyces proteolyticus]